MKENIKEIEVFILANYSHLTVADMAEELTNPQENPKDNEIYIRSVCRRLGVSPLTRGKQIVNFIQDHKHWSKEKLAEKLNICLSEVCRYMKLLGLETKKPKLIPMQKEIQDNFEVIIKKYKERVKEIKGNRPKAEYNQTGSQTLDELRGIKSTIRLH